MENDKMDELLTSVLETEYYKIGDIENINVPDMENTISLFESKVHSGSGSKKWAGIAAACCIVVLSFILSTAYEIPQVKAFKFSIIKTFIKAGDDVITVKHSDTRPPARSDRPPAADDNPQEIKRRLAIEEAQKILPFHLIIPQYVPEGYKFYEVEVSEYLNGDFMTTLSYRDDTKKYVAVGQRTVKDFDMTVNYRKTEDTQVKKIIIMGQEATMVTSSDFSSVMWFNDGLEYKVFGSVPEEEMIKILDSLK